MNASDEILSYSQSNNGHIYRCQHCGMIHFVFKSIAIALTQIEFDALHDCITSVEDRHFDYPHPGGWAATLTFNKLEDGFFCVLQEELPEMQQLIAEADLMIAAYRQIED